MHSMSALASHDRLAHIADFRALAEVLGVPQKTLWHLANSGRDSAYVTYAIPKKRGGTREISAPSDFLKTVQRRLLALLESAYDPPVSVHGFVRDRSIVSNSKRHVGSRWTLNLDLTDYFPSVKFWRIRGALTAKPYSASKPVATTIARLACYRDELPQGAPTSPVLANIVSRSLDIKLKRLAARHGATYTRYADDITISGHSRRVPENLAIKDASGKYTCSPQLSREIEDAGFRVNIDKFRVQYSDRRQVVTGLKTNVFINVDRRYVRSIRATLHAWEKFGLEQAEREYLAKHWRRRGARTPPSLQSVVRGKISFLLQVKGIESPVVLPILRRFALLTSDLELYQKAERIAAAAAAAATSIHERMGRSTCVIDSGGRQGTAFWVKDIGLITCAHCIDDSTQIDAYSPDRPNRKIPVRLLHIDKDADIAILEYSPIVGIEPLMPAHTIPAMGETVHVAGYPNYSPGMTVSVRSCTITHTRPAGPHHRLALSTGVVAGMSGGPVVNSSRAVIGIAVTGDASETGQDSGEEENGAIPWSIAISLFNGVGSA